LAGGGILSFQNGNSRWPWRDGRSTLASEAPAITDPERYRLINLHTRVGAFHLAGQDLKVVFAVNFHSWLDTIQHFSADEL